VKKNIVFRTDGNGKAGIGHVMRCISLAKELLGKASVTFILSDESKDIKQFIEDTSGKCRVEVLPDVGHEYIHGKPFSSEHSLKDAKYTENIINGLGEVDFLIADHYGIDRKWEKQFKGMVKHIMVIDDLANRKHFCDILHDQNFYVDSKTRYDSLVDNKCVKLLGTSYALLRDEFKVTEKAPVKDKVESILVSFGGSDADNVTRNVLEVLAQEEYKHINVNVVTGNYGKNKHAIRQICDNNTNFTYRQQIDYMAKLMCEADLFIGAGGSTSWERMAVGLPSIIISIADNQTKICEDMAKEGLVKYVGTAKDYNPENFKSCLNEVIKDKKWRKFVSEEGRRLVDGRGAKKVAAHIFSLLINIRKASDSDCENIYNRRNSEINRNYSNDGKKFSYESHCRWFEKIVKSEDSDLLIASSDNAEIGVVRFDYTGDKSLISIYLILGWHNKGWGLPLLISSINWLKQNRNNIKEINAEILHENKASKQIFADTGFCVISESENKSLWLKTV